jgi:hypothetical protein
MFLKQRAHHRVRASGADPLIATVGVARLRRDAVRANIRHRARHPADNLFEMKEDNYKLHPPNNHSKKTEIIIKKKSTRRCNPS